MTLAKPDIEKIISELKFTTSRSGGPGGQNVNKVNTKVTLRWHVRNSMAINDDQKELIFLKLAKVVNLEEEVVLMADNHRSQLQNREEVIDKLNSLLIKAFTVPKPRKPTKPTKSSVRRRLEAKKRHGEKKKLRKGLE